MPVAGVKIKPLFIIVIIIVVVVITRAMNYEYFVLIGEIIFSEKIANSDCAHCIQLRFYDDLRLLSTYLPRSFLMSLYCQHYD